MTFTSLKRNQGIDANFQELVTETYNITIEAEHNYYEQQATSE
jgi:hypothetical protein